MSSPVIICTYEEILSTKSLSPPITRWLFPNSHYTIHLPILDSTSIDLFVDALSPWSIAKNRLVQSGTMIILDCGAACLI